MYKLKRRDNTNDSFIEVGIIKAPDMYSYSVIMFMSKFLNNEVQRSLPNLFKKE